MKLSPASISFNSFVERSTRTITLTNNNDVTYAFKVMTTTPKRYKVIPNVSLLKPNQSIEIGITFKGFTEREDKSLRNDLNIYQLQDKFQIKCIPILKLNINQTNINLDDNVKLHKNWKHFENMVLNKEDISIIKFHIFLNSAIDYNSGKTTLPILRSLSFTAFRALKQEFITDNTNLKYTTSRRKSVNDRSSTSSYLSSITPSSKPSEHFNGNGTPMSDSVRRQSFPVRSSSFSSVRVI